MSFVKNVSANEMLRAIRFDSNKFWEAVQDKPHGAARKAFEKIFSGECVYFQLLDEKIYLKDCWKEFNSLLEPGKVYHGDFENILTMTSFPFEYHFNGGDGNDLIKVMSFVNPNKVDDVFYVTFSGWYSSWDESDLNEAYLSEPYTFTETRFKRLKKNS